MEEKRIFEEKTWEKKLAQNKAISPFLTENSYQYIGDLKSVLRIHMSDY